MGILDERLMRRLVDWRLVNRVLYLCLSGVAASSSTSEMLVKMLPF